MSGDLEQYYSKVDKICMKVVNGDGKYEKCEASKMLKEMSEGIVSFSDFPEQKKSADGYDGKIMGSYSRENVSRDILIASLQGVIRRAASYADVYKILSPIVYGLAHIGAGANATNIWNRLLVIAVEDCTTKATPDTLLKVYALYVDCADIKKHFSPKHMMAAAMVLAGAAKCRITDWAANPADNYSEMVDKEFSSDLHEKLSKLKKELKGAKKSEKASLKKKVEKLKDKIEEFEASDEDVCNALEEALDQDKGINNVVKYIHYLHAHDFKEKKETLSCDFIIKAFKHYLKKAEEFRGKDVAIKYLKKIVTPIYKIDSWHRSRETQTVDSKKTTVAVSDEKALLLHLHMAFMLDLDIFVELETLVGETSIEKYMSKFVKSLKGKKEEEGVMSTYADDYKLYKKGKLIKSLYKNELKERVEKEKTSARALVQLHRDTVLSLIGEIPQGAEKMDEETDKIIETKIKEMRDREKKIESDVASIPEPGIPVFCIDKHTGEGGKQFRKYADIIHKDYFSKAPKTLIPYIKETLAMIHFVNVKAVLTNVDESMSEFENKWFLASELAALKL